MSCQDSIPRFPAEVRIYRQDQDTSHDASRSGQAWIQLADMTDDLHTRATYERTDLWTVLVRN